MIRTTTLSDPQVSAALLAGELVVLKTDTIYGIVARASDAAAVERLYRAKFRSRDKACIVLVTTASDIPHLTEEEQALYLALHETRPTTVVTTARDLLTKAPHQQGTLAFRLVSGELADLIRRAGPLLAPSANPEGLPPATTISEAVNYFGEAVSVYVDSGQVTDAAPSRIVRLENGQVVTLRG